MPPPHFSSILQEITGSGSTCVAGFTRVDAALVSFNDCFLFMGWTTVLLMLLSKLLNPDFSSALVLLREKTSKLSMQVTKRYPVSFFRGIPKLMRIDSFFLLCKRSTRLKRIATTKETMPVATVIIMRESSRLPM